MGSRAFIPPSAEWFWSTGPGACRVVPYGTGPTPGRARQALASVAVAATVCVISSLSSLPSALGPLQLLEIIRKEDVVLRAILTTHHHW